MPVGIYWFEAFFLFRDIVSIQSTLSELYRRQCRRRKKPYLGTVILELFVPRQAEEPYCGAQVLSRLLYAIVILYCQGFC